MECLKGCAERLIRGMGYDSAEIPKGQTFIDYLAQENMSDALNRREIRMQLKQMFLDEGIDVPGAGIGIILSGTGMERQRIQRLGRVLRRDAQKKMACLYYLFIKGSMEEKSYFPFRREYFQVEDWEYQEGFMKK